MNVTIRIEAHPLDTIRTGVESCDMDLQMRQMCFVRHRCRRRDTEMVVSPPAFCDRERLFVVLTFMVQGHSVWFQFAMVRSDSYAVLVIFPGA